MFKKVKDMSREELEDYVYVDICCTLALGVISLFVGGYVVGRLTAIKDLENGKLDMFIPKKYTVTHF